MGLFLETKYPVSGKVTSLEVFHSQRNTDSSYMGSTLDSTCDQAMRLTFLLSLPKPALLLKDLKSAGFNNMRSHKTLHQISKVV